MSEEVSELPVWFYALNLIAIVIILPVTLRALVKSRWGQSTSIKFANASSGAKAITLLVSLVIGLALATILAYTFNVVMPPNLSGKSGAYTILCCMLPVTILPIGFVVMVWIYYQDTN